SRIDLIVDAGELAGIDHRYPVIAEYIDQECSLCGGRVDAYDLLLRKTEHHCDRLQLGDDGNAGGVRGVNDVALIDLAQAGAAGYRRDDLGVAERRSRIVDGGLIGVYECFLLGDYRT